MTRNVFSTAATTLLLLFLSGASSATLGAERYSDYITELTRLVFARTEAPGAAPRRVPGVSGISRNRKFVELLSGEHLEFSALPTKPEWEEKLIPIRIPVRKGLQGYRLFLVNRNNPQTIGKIETLDQLRALPTGSGAQWSTTVALEEAGFTVVKGQSKNDLVKMLDLKRFVTYGRGIDEIFAEYDALAAAHPSLSIDREVALFIPHPVYFFVTPKRPDLAERIERGLRDMIADGSFNDLFRKHFEDDIKRARLDRRRIFTIANPLLGPETPLKDPTLWFVPTRAPDDDDEQLDPIR
ncbi:hypothetical protein [Roseibium aggregatum]|uniref:Solute-binding protein family 3/N-terminal domain-containing protein n=1 Tax=Roseibium aggregatum TaxID=187304 RepID=A0A939EAX9_9HYPH|nr:hypothetical protein [Roseibium aggregatum]MBN9669139.1 hypothetical protein [Roseibium aggregatum]